MGGTIILVDTSYLIFQTYFKCNPKFSLQKFNHEFELCLLNIVSHYKSNTKDIVFAIDCDKSSVWRKEVYESYKMNRKINKNKFNSQIFRHVYKILIPKLQEIYCLKVIEHAQLEADDIIGILNKYITTKLCRKVVIVSEDKDFIQLHSERTIIVNSKMLDISNKYTSSLLRNYLQIKIMIGDRGDNIGPILKRMNMSQALSIIENPLDFASLLDDPVIRRKYELNALLIDFGNIPKDFQKRVLYKYRYYSKTT